MNEPQTTESEHDDLHESMIRDRLSKAPGHWSNKDIACLLRQIDKSRPRSEPSDVIEEF